MQDNEAFKPLNPDFGPLPQAGAADQPEPSPDAPVPAGFNERLVAYVIDALPFVFAAYFTLNMMIKAGRIEYTEANDLKWKLIWIALYIVYEAVLSSGGRATLGKFLMSIRVRAADGGPLPFGKALVRAFAYFLSSATLNLGYLMALFGRDRKALHDYIAGSRVVSIRQRGDLANGLVLAFSWALMAVFAGSWINQTFLKLTPSERRQVAAAHMTISKLSVLEEIHKQKYGGYTDDLKRLARLTGKPEAVRAEIVRNLADESLELATNGAQYRITAKARNWRKTEVEVSGPMSPRPAQ